eukprot:CAMPEP_0167791562 /NCGR_PEP_ID=MMETSP0111_2-20121227/12012_1 /TAXON_ID=91324 /ORGANISM="Lotharella globosa, Strain CCCM811" /LENGTH=62 /DNA_ID=CAMNT_0007684259 /DNA_START=128 /DNA_END=316 /DNA_ORIENTATION=-
MDMWAKTGYLIYTTIGIPNVPGDGEGISESEEAMFLDHDKRTSRTGKGSTDVPNETYTDGRA